MGSLGEYRLSQGSGVGSGSGLLSVLTVTVQMAVLPPSTVVTAIVAEPLPTASTLLLLSTLATARSLEVQVSLLSVALPGENRDLQLLRSAHCQFQTGFVQTCAGDRNTRPIVPDCNIVGCLCCTVLSCHYYGDIGADCRQRLGERLFIANTADHHRRTWVFRSNGQQGAAKGHIPAGDILGLVLLVVFWRDSL